MAHFCSERKRLKLRVLYCGPSGSGKSTNVAAVYGTLGAEPPTEASAGWRPLGTIALEHALDLGLELEIAETTVGDPTDTDGAELLAEADAVVFVGDVRKERLRANLMAWAELLSQARRAERDIDEVAVILQWNRADAESAIAGADLETMLQVQGRPAFEGIATLGRGVGMCFTEAVRRAAARSWTDLGLRRFVPRDVFAASVDAAVLQRRVRREDRPEEASDPVADEVADEVLAIDSEVESPPAEELSSDESVGFEAADGGADEEVDDSAPVPLGPWQRWAEGRRSAPAGAIGDASLARIQRGAKDALRATSYVHRVVRAFEASRIRVAGAGDRELAEVKRALGFVYRWVGAVESECRRSRAPIVRSSCVSLDDLVEGLEPDLGAILETTGAAMVKASLPEVFGSRQELEAALFELLRSALEALCDDQRVLRIERGRGSSLRLRGPFARSRAFERGLEIAGALLSTQGARLRAAGVGEESTGALVVRFAAAPSVDPGRREVLLGGGVGSRAVSSSVR